MKLKRALITIIRLVFSYFVSARCYNMGDRTTQLLDTVGWDFDESIDLEKEFEDLKAQNVFGNTAPIRSWLDNIQLELYNFSHVVDVLKILEDENYSIQDMVFLGTQVDLTPGIWNQNPHRDDGVKEILFKICGEYTTNDDCFHLLYFMAKATVKRMGILNHISEMSSNLSGLKLMYTLYKKQSIKSYNMDRALFADISTKFEACNFCGFYYMDLNKQTFMKEYVRMIKLSPLFQETETCYDKCHNKEYPVIMVLHNNKGYLTSQNRIKCNERIMNLAEPIPFQHHKDVIGGLINDTFVICDSRVDSFRFQGRGMGGMCYKILVNSTYDDYHLSLGYLGARIRYDNIPFTGVTVYTNSGVISHNVTLNTEGYTTSGIYGKKYMTTGNGYKIWMTGGYVENYNFKTYTTLKMDIKNTYVFQHMEWNKGPDLPIPLSDHCIAEVNSTHSFVGGGNTNGEPSRRVWIFAWWEDRWTELEPMPITISNPQCSKYTSHGDILVASREHALSLNSQTLEWTKIGRKGRLHASGDLVYGGEDVGAYLIGGRRTYKFTGDMWIELAGWYNNVNSTRVLLAIPVKTSSRLIPRCFPTM